MELAACKVAFIFVPLRNNLGQNFHVRARLDRYHAVRDVETKGAAIAVAIIAELL